jgi:DNA-binding transcriptional LysR family regulator
MSGIHGMNLRSFDLNLLLAFEALVEERSVTRAARRLGLSQPATSNALARLRRTFDDALLVRTAGGMGLTPVAERLAGPVRAALAQLRAAVEEPEAFDPAASERSFNVQTTDYVEMMLLAPAMRALAAEAPGLRLRIRRPRRLFAPPAPELLAGRYDLAIGFYPDAVALDPAVHSRVLWEEANVCVAAKDNARIRGAVSLEEYAAARHVAVFYRGQGHGVIDAVLAQHGLARETAVLAPHFVTAPFLVASSDLIATMPERLARHFEALLPLQVLPLPVELPPFRLAMLWHGRAEADPAHRWLRALIASAAGS